MEQERNDCSCQEMYNYCHYKDMCVLFVDEHTPVYTESSGVPVHFRLIGQMSQLFSKSIT